MRVTPEDIMALLPSEDWSRERVTQWLNGRPWVQPLDILKDKSLNIDDRICIGCRLLSKGRRVMWVCDCVERALHYERKCGFEPDSRSWVAIETARRWACGKATDEELTAASYDADAVVVNADFDIISYTAQAVVWATSSHVFYNDAIASVYEAAEAIAWATVRDISLMDIGFTEWSNIQGDAYNDECEWQLARLIDYFGRRCKNEENL